MKSSSKILLIILGLILFAISGFFIVIKMAFGPIVTNSEIELENGNVLLCKETYNADMAAVFYDVSFSLKGEDSNVFIGFGSFNDDNWKSNISTFFVDDWLFIKVEDVWSANELKLLGIETKSNTRIDTIFSPMNLIEDTLWMQAVNKVPADSDQNSSRLDSIKSNNFYVTYTYRPIYPNEPSIDSKTIWYQFDEISGEIRTKKILN